MKQSTGHMLWVLFFHFCPLVNSHLLYLGLNPPLLLVGSKAAFDTVGNVVQEKVIEAMRNTPALSFGTPQKDENEGTVEEDGTNEDELPFS